MEGNKSMSMQKGICLDSIFFDFLLNEITFLLNEIT